MKIKLTAKLAWILLIINGIILFLLILLRLVPMIRVAKAGYQLSKATHMKTYAVCSPFVILMNDREVGKTNFTLLDTRHPLFLNLNCLDNNGRMQEAQLCIGTNFDFSCIVSFEGEPRIHEYSLTKDFSNYTDLNADGIFDLRTSLQPSPRLDIWLDGKWTEVALGKKDGRYQKQLISGEPYSFNMQTGMWCPVRSKNSTWEK